ncbi:hypothetical protein F3N42_13655 [Marinihelvus fidelis]|uniref:Uncharacterized protein n=1 Tax=Marinihelvus fidelis TaxID=2613842 RepID=A0A5N0T7T5_9GAMM|nr:hypothetical protein [Marinihelvus fidelis]KAA9130207.1 hypothetical protein F3N42_13655 [Marinihelvus fidelis]
MRKFTIARLLLATSLALPAASLLAEEVRLGLGYDRARNGHGFELHKFGDLWSLYFYTYDANGDPEWFLGLAEMDGGLLAGDLNRYTYDESRSPAAQADTVFDGEFRLDFSDGENSEACDDGTWRGDAEQLASFYWRVGNSSGTWCTELLKIDDGAARGTYYGGVWYGGQGDSGYGFTMSHMDDTVSALAYYYDANGNPRWALGVAPQDATAVALTHFTGYCRTCTPVPIDPFPAGTLALDWAQGSNPGGGNDQAELDLSYPQWPFGTFYRQFTLERLSDGDVVGEYSKEYAMGSDVMFVAAWQLDDGGSDDEQVMMAPPIRLADTERVANDLMPGPQANAAVGLAADGSYVITWEDDNDENGYYQVYARGFHPNGDERFSRITVNTAGAGQQRFPDIAVAPNGDFVVVWEDDTNDNFFSDIMARGFHANGTQKFADIVVNDDSAGHQMDPAVGIADDGSFVVVWADDTNANELYQVAARGFNANGTEKFRQRELNLEDAGQQFQPDVAVGPNGDFAAAWVDDADLNHYYEIHGRGFSASGSAWSKMVTVNQVATASQYHPAVSIGADRSFAVAWVDQAHSVKVRAFESRGDALYDEVLVSDESQSVNDRPAIALLPDGGAVVAWGYLPGDGEFDLAAAVVNPEGGHAGDISLGRASAAERRLPSIAIR